MSPEGWWMVQTTCACSQSQRNVNMVAVQACTDSDGSRHTVRFLVASLARSSISFKAASESRPEPPERREQQLQAGPEQPGNSINLSSAHP